ncbi:MAG: hypothetical protein C0603_04020 [Denitrovibrio sp.]|nr:MAG: hypothetical protein C0603_04020 [Denitrovibrio sp.]
MQNNKNGNGKRVRTPITTSTPKPTNSKKPKKEAKVTTLLFAGGLAVIAVVLLAVVLIMFGRGKQVTDLSPSAQPEVVQKVADADQVLDAVYLSLFTYGLDKNSIKDKTEVTTDREADLKLLIDPFHIEAIELKQTISEKLTDLGLLVADEDAILASNSKVKLAITFTDPVIIEKPKPNSIAFVIDDCGYSVELAKKLAALPYSLTMAIIPHTKYAKETSKIAKKNGKTVFLHQPMQPESYPKTDPGKGAILLNMPESIIKASIDKNMKNVGNVDGFNNHMCSALTQNKEKMQQVFKYIKKYTTTFVDSYTAQGTVAFDECKAAGFRCGINRKFIDNESDYDYIRSKIIEGTEIAREDGSVIMIGHLREGTVDALAKILPELVEAGYTLVSATELAQK